MSTPGVVKAMRNLSRWSAGGEWRDDLLAFIDGYFDRMGRILKVERDEFEDAVGSPVVDALITWATEDFWTQELEPDHENIIDDYLKRRGWKDTVGGKRYLKAFRQSVVGVYEVIDVAPGSHLVVRDLLRGGDGFRVEDVEGSKIAVIWDRIAARVVMAGEKSRFSDCVLPLSFDAAERVAAMIRKLAEKTRSGAEDVSVAETRVQSRIPELVAFVWAADIYGEMLELPDDVHDEDGDGEPFSSVLVDFPITGEARQIEKGLDECPDFVRLAESKPIWRWVERKPPAPLLDTVLRHRDDEIKETLGTVLIDDETLSIDAHTRPLAERVKTLLMDALPGILGMPSIVEIDDADALLDEDLPWNAGDALGRMEDFWRENASKFNEELDRRYADWLAEKHETLDDLSPREAVARDDGARKVAELLKSIENASARQMHVWGAPQYDYSWMWRELGIDELRH